MDALATLQKLWDLVQDDRLKETFLTLKAQLLDLKEENIRLREQNLALEAETQKGKPSLTYDGKMYWDETGEKRDGPFCPTCYDNHQKRIRLRSEKTGWRCAVSSTYIRMVDEPDDDPNRPFRRTWAG